MRPSVIHARRAVLLHAGQHRAGDRRSTMKCPLQPTSKGSRTRQTIINAAGSVRRTSDCRRKPGLPTAPTAAVAARVRVQQRRCRARAGCERAACRMPGARSPGAAPPRRRRCSSCRCGPGLARLKPRQAHVARARTGRAPVPAPTPETGMEDVSAPQPGAGRERVPVRRC